FSKAFVIALVIVGLYGVTRAQETENIIRPNTKAGSAAWVFTFGGLSSLGVNAVELASLTVPGETSTTVDVYGAGYKYYLSDDMALRALLGFSTTSSGDEAKAGKTTMTNWGIAAGIEMHTHAVYSTSPYFGAQIGYTSASGDFKQTPSGGQTSETKGSGSAFSIGVLAGFDWYFTRGIAVGGEYMLGFSSLSSSTTVTAAGTSTTTDNPSASTIGISAGDVHLVVHF
ncbi:MAG TPA: outer membrane beta-barrel protein, partial [Steroidobacteraceae bacterium]|nr:outer membrane beta-barrel protein [Steroidobacteraceae bacterium]